MVFTISIHPWPFILAQACAVSYNAFACLICALGGTISILQTLYVIRFGLVFSWNPFNTGRIILAGVVIITSIPNLVGGILAIIQDIPIEISVNFLSHTEVKPSMAGFSVILVHTACWNLFCFIFFVLAFLVIPVVMKSRTPEGLTTLFHPARWRRYVAGCVGVVAILIVLMNGNNKQDGQHMPVQVHIVTLFINMILVFHFADHDVRRFGHQYLSQRFYWSSTSVMEQAEVLPRIGIASQSTSKAMGSYNLAQIQAP